MRVLTRAMSVPVEPSAVLVSLVVIALVWLPGCATSMVGGIGVRDHYPEPQALYSNGANEIALIFLVQSYSPRDPDRDSRDVGLYVAHGDSAAIAWSMQSQALSRAMGKRKGKWISPADAAWIREHQGPQHGRLGLIVGDSKRNPWATCQCHEDSGSLESCLPNSMTGAQLLDINKPFGLTCMADSLMIACVSLDGSLKHGRAWWGYPCLTLLLPAAVAIDVVLFPVYYLILWAKLGGSGY